MYSKVVDVWRAYSAPSLGVVQGAWRRVMCPQLVAELRATRGALVASCTHRRRQ